MATDSESAFDIDKLAEHFDVYIGTTLDDEGDVVLTDGEPTTGTKLGEGSAYALSRIPVTGGYRIVFASSASWVTEFESGDLSITVRARDVAGNEVVMNASIVIDTVPPVTTSAATGYGWDSSDEEEATGVANGVRLVMNESIDPDSVQAGDFEINNVEAAAADVGTGDGKADNGVSYKQIIYLTAQSDFDADERPRVEVVGEVTDLSGNEVDVENEGASEKRASDKLAPTVTVSRDVALLAAEDDEVVVTIASDEKLRADGAVVSIIGPSGSDSNVMGQATGRPAARPLVQARNQRRMRRPVPTVSRSRSRTWAATNPSTTLSPPAMKKLTLRTA